MEQAQAVLDALGDGPRFLHVGQVLDQDDELVSAQSGQSVRSAGKGVQASGDLDQHHITGRVAVGVR